jgi:peptidoglycan/LPS O-acetylase OafA/YrhL
MRAELPGAQLSFTVAAIALGLALLGMTTGPMQTLIGLVLILVALWFVITTFTQKQEPPRARRRRVLYAGLAAGGSALLLWRLAWMAVNPLLALAAVCAALGVVAILGAGESSEDEDA